MNDLDWRMKTGKEMTQKNQRESDKACEEKSDTGSMDIDKKANLSSINPDDFEINQCPDLTNIVIIWIFSSLEIRE